ncbi:MAG: [FeFe] hydrogenase H-cluster maturation GTPase HydF [Thermoguttaceae bacterium]|nr:[FeFe] hydrogenase H-cluster maturation GTPase HydF [Thermoguttaceae bacterium]
MTISLQAPKGFRLHIGVFGRRNVGKSSTLNALTRQRVSVVSDVPGTTTDPVEKPMELSPLGPVLFIDTAGIDDEGALGLERVAQTRKVIDRADLGLIVVDASLGAAAWGGYEETLAADFERRGVPILVLINKCDLAAPDAGFLADCAAKNRPTVEISAKNASELNRGAPQLREALTKLAPEEFLTPPPIISDLVAPGEFVVLVTPIDKEAPKGRLILPQVQTIRDLLDGDCGVVVVKENLLAAALERFRTPPALVVTDSQAFKAVAAIVPEDVPLTSFSILFARQKGDFATLLAGARKIDDLTENSRVLIAESCTHHPIEEDIGTVKIPRWIRAKYGEGVVFERAQGEDFPDVEGLRRYDLIIHCGGCMFNRRAMLTRVARAAESGTPITNYGLAIARLNGILERAVQPLNR